MTPSSGAVSRGRRLRRIREAATGWGFLLPFAALFALIFLVPIGISIKESFFRDLLSGGGLHGGGELVSTFVGWTNYADVAGSPVFWQGMGRVLLFGIIQIPIMIGLALALAILLDSLISRATPALRLSYFLPYAIPGVVAALVWTYIYSPQLSPINKMLEPLGASIDFFAPIVWLLVSSTKTNNQLYSTNPWLPGDAIVENYHGLMSWTQGNFWRWVANSVFYSGAAAAIGTLVSVMAGYGLAKFRIMGKGMVTGVILAGLLLPISLLTVPLYLMFHNLGLVNTPLAVIIPSCVSPFGVFLARVYVESSVPDEMLEAARIDGAGEVRIFVSLVMRLLAPSMVTIFLFIFVMSWNNFLLPLLMINSAELKPVTLGLYGMMSYFNPQYGAVLQGALLGVMPLVILFLGLQRYWQAGLAAGSVK